jgi:SPP1 gp7 family putative phage head morphogenesis protein
MAGVGLEEFDEAVKWFLARVPVTRKAWDAMTLEARRKAFTVSGVASADVLSSIHKELSKAVEKGTTLQDFRKTVARQLLDQWQGTVSAPAWRMETIFRTNVLMAYSAGRWKQMQEPAVKKRRPYAMYDSILDKRTTKRCERLDGKVLPLDEWEKRGLVPPNHFNCRSALRSIDKGDLEEYGGVSKVPADIKADKGFGLSPNASEWKPDLSKYPPELAKQVEKTVEPPAGPVPMPPPPGAKLVPEVKAADSFNIQIPTKRLSEDVKRALAAIDSAHAFPKMPRISVRKYQKASEDAAYRYFTNGSQKPVEITIRPGNTHAALSMLHEVGHYLDHHGHGKAGTFLTVSGGAKEVLDVIKKSAAYAGLYDAEAAFLATATGNQAKKLKASFEYLRGPKELWARAYAQWVAERSGDARILEQLEKTRARVDGKTYVPYQWDDGDWKTIREAIDAYMKARGWTPNDREEKAKKD